MKFATLTIRSIAVAAALLAAGASANALTISSTGITANSVQAFSTGVLKSFNAVRVSITPLGNTTAVAGVTGAFSLPITSITINSKLHVTGGASSGSALRISRNVYDADDNQVNVGFTVANFVINYETKQVLADLTLNGATTAKVPFYNFNVATPLALKYKFPLNIVGNELLDNLRLTPEAKTASIDGLLLEDFDIPSLDLDYGTLTQNISLVARKPAVSAAPYIAK